MNKANLKSYAPKARLDFIKAVTERANVLGISAAGTVPAQLRGDVAIIDGREWPAKVAGRRDELVARIKRHGFEQIMDEVAYTWFNRFAALRYMEIHDYLGHGWRVLSSRDGGLPEILSHASEVTLPGLNTERARNMQLAGNQDNELYKLLLVAQCNELSRVMPFLFERIDDETELLLPENLLRTDSIVAKLVESVPEEEWHEIEVIGWLYQFYISEKKDQVIGKVVKSEDIPAATQLFTPNWIVQYLVQNSVGRLWLMANPTSTLASQWPYYIQPAEQTPEVQAQLDALIQTRIGEDGDALNPETITVLDPACGSGHILVVAYDVLKAIYLERGYQPRAIPRLLLQKNLYGLDIDDRAAQLAAFAVLMKARADDRHLFNDPLQLNVLSLRESKGLDVEELGSHLAQFGLRRVSIKLLVDVFMQAKSFGSLLQIPKSLKEELNAMTEGLQHALRDGDLYSKQAAVDLLPLVLQSLVLSRSFDAAIANPPYMGAKGMNQEIKDFAKAAYPESKPDLFAMFMERSQGFCGNSGLSALVTMQSWMFLSSFAALRRSLLEHRTIFTLLQIGYNSFPELNSKVAQACAFITYATRVPGHVGCYMNLNSAPQSADKGAVFLCRDPDQSFAVKQEDFCSIPDSPLPFWVSAKTLALLSNAEKLDAVCKPRTGINTGDNAKYLKLWHELSVAEICFSASSRDAALICGKKWFPYNKGGSLRKWYGNNELVVNWAQDGQEIKDFAVARNSGSHWSRFIQNVDYFFRPGITWSFINSSGFGVRFKPAGFLFDVQGTSAFPAIEFQDYCGALLCSRVAEHFLSALNPTLSFQAGNVSSIPFIYDASAGARLSANVQRAVELAKRDWDQFETSWEFGRNPLVSFDGRTSIASAWVFQNQEAIHRREEMRGIEETNNSLLLAVYGLEDELSPTVPDSKITLARSDRERNTHELLSFVVGCVMGRYSLDEPGLIYAQAGNAGFNATRYEKKFPADVDGIVPLTDERWFQDDAASRVPEFLRAVWGADRLEENMAWLAQGLGTKGGETPDESIRRYLSDKFFKEHLQTYKKRPIYWLFSSGKQGAFQALVYLHRYNEGTLARMRAVYVLPLIAKVVSRLEMLDKDVVATSSAAARTKLQKQIESLRKKQIELLAYDEKLRHYADMRITLDLDDGVKVNYAKFGDLVTESKAITGGSDE